MYEDDTPPAERRAQALSLDRDLLRELLGQEELRDLLDADALAEVERSLRGDPRNADELHDLLRLRGDLRAGEFDEALRRRCWRRERRAIRVRIAGEERADRRRGRGPLPRRARRDAAGRAARGVPRGRARTRCASSCSRFAQRPRPVHDRRGERALRPRRRAACCAALEREEQLVRGELRPGGTEREWCDPDVLRRLRRASLAALRREVEPVEQAALGRFLPAGTGSTAGRRCARRSSRSRRWRCRSRSGRPRSCRGACPATGLRSSTRCARRARSSGSAPGSTAWRSTSARTRRRSAAPAGRAARGRGRTTASARRSDAAREFWLDLLAETGLEAEEALPALWELVWAGEVTNDAWTPLRAGRRYGVPQPERRPRRFSRRRATAVTATQGRWSLTERLFAGAARTGARSPSCCSSGRGSSRATASAPRGSPAATAPSTAS